MVFSARWQYFKLKSKFLIIGSLLEVAKINLIIELSKIFFRECYQVNLYSLAMRVLVDDSTLTYVPAVGFLPTVRFVLPAVHTLLTVHC
jgi:hypothetical protein